jgi:hypothetical protein
MGLTGLLGCMHKKDNIILFRKRTYEEGFQNTSESLRWLVDEFNKGSIKRKVTVEYANRR